MPLTIVFYIYIYSSIRKVDIYVCVEHVLYKAIEHAMLFPTSAHTSAHYRCRLCFVYVALPLWSG